MTGRAETDHVDDGRPLRDRKSSPQGLSAL